MNIIEYIKKEAKKTGIRWTNQRQQIAEVFASCSKHITAEQLHKMVKEIDSTVSIATIYRTLALLEEIEVAVKRDFNSSSATYENIIQKDHHHHIIDIETGDVIEFSDERLEKLQAEIAEEFGYKIISHKFELFGKKTNKIVDDEQ